MKVCCRRALLILLICSAVIISGCTRREIRSPADELCMHHWGALMDNGNRIDLSVEDELAAFSVKNDAYTLSVSGRYMLDDSVLVINDSETHMNYRFSYTVHGDSLELSYREGVVRLDKK